MRDSAFKLGLAGRDILASRSPWMHEEEGRAQNMNLSYTLFDFNARGWADGDLPRLLERLSGEGFDGINVTFPFKQAAIAYLDDLSDDARKVGAVNTIAFRNGKFSGYNTDLTGFAQSVREGLGEIEGDRAVQIGAGGAGAATAHALLALGLGHLTIFDNDETRRQALCTNLGKLYGDRVRAGEDIVVATREAAGIINATPVGMAKYPGLPVPAA
ncbi:MAG: shikimate dehydrogenase, partial [Alphaproteobacteria bacterium]|nr:shikimate dehydrogenase [Alphaproteobacteria bacterium]